MPGGGRSRPPFSFKFLATRARGRRAAAGQTPSEVAKRIDHLGWRTKQWTARRTGEQQGGGRWTARQIISMLRNPVYLGQFAEGEATRPGCHEAIVAPEMNDAARKQLDSRRRADTPTRHTHEFPLRGEIICPKCRRPLSSYVITKHQGLRKARIDDAVPQIQQPSLVAERHNRPGGRVRAPFERCWRRLCGLQFAFVLSRFLTSVSESLIENTTINNSQ